LQQGFECPARTPHKESISIAVRHDAGKLVMECVIETNAKNHFGIILDFIHELRGELQVTFEEGTWATCQFLDTVRFSLALL
jgi:hypothetical protein